MGLSIWQIAIIAVVALILFGGGGKIVRLMGDMGSGLRAFKKGISDDPKAEGEDDSEEPQKIAEAPKPSDSEPESVAPKKKKAKSKKSKKSKAKKSKAKKS